MSKKIKVSIEYNPVTKLVDVFINDSYLESKKVGSFTDTDNVRYWELARGTDLLDE
ncbi:MAG: hypothetical protein QN632_08720 [Nitrososphaeraceae archaeon]|nr:hypothetical protein [Nitrososphaeraceae archaeon]